MKRYRKTRPGDVGHGIEDIWGISADGESALLSNAEVVIATESDKLAEALRQIAETWEDCDTYTLGLIARDMLTVCGLRKS